MTDPSRGRGGSVRSRLVAKSGTVLACILVLLARSSALACDTDTQARIDFIESRLADGQKHASWWWHGWMAVFVAGVVVESVDAGLERNTGKRADDLITVGESVLGIADLVFDPIVAREGVSRLREMPAGNDAQCALHLAAAEETLRSAASQVEERTSWMAHLIELAINLGAGLAVSEGWGERATGWTSFGVGESLSEAQLWTLPTRPIDDLDAYRRTFDSAPLVHTDSAGWHLAPGMGGIRLVRSF